MKMSESKKAERVLDGQEIASIHSAGSYYRPNEIILSNGKENFKMQVSEFLKIINGVRFKATRARKYYHLTIISDGKDG